MGDVLPPKRETVERLKRRFEIYRTVHSDRFPKYEQNANDSRETERQETLLLRQRFLESKAKKAKNKSDHHRSYKDSISDSNKTPMAKSVKRAAEEQLPQLQASSNEESEKSSKMARTDSLPDKKPDLVLSQQTSCLNASLQSQQQQSSQQTSTLSSFSVQIVPNFTNQQTVQKPLNSPLTAQVSLPQNNQTDKKPVCISKDENSQSGRNSCSNPIVECKQEKDNDPSDMCQFKTVTPNGNSCDSLSDTFPSIGVNDDSGEDMLPPEVLHDLIKDMTENPDYSDLMTDFFDDGGLKDQEMVGKEITDLVKDSPNTFQSDEVPLVPIQTSLFRNFPGSNETPISTLSAPSIPTSSLYNQPAQRLPPSYMNTNIRFNYKMTSEPTGSLAARTLKQLAEQHQSLQQQQQVFNPSLVNRPSFSKDNPFANQSQNSSNFLNGTNTVNQSSEGANNSTSSAYTLDRLSEEFFGTLPSNCEQSSPNNRFDMSKQRMPENQQQQQQVEEPPPYGTTRLLSHYSENAQVRPLNSINSNQYVPHSPIGGGNRQIQNNSDLRFQFPQQPQQIHMSQTEEFKQQQLDKMQPHSNVFNNYSQPQQTNPSLSQSLPVSQSLTYTTQFSPTITKPPPEYKAHHSLISGQHVEQSNNLLQPMYNQSNKNTKFGKVQRPPNVTISSDGTALTSATHNWRPNMRSLPQSIPVQNRFRTNLTNFNNYSLQSTGPPLSPLYNQYRAPGIQMPVTGNQMPVTGNQISAVGNRPPGPRNQIPVPRNQIPMSGNQLANNRLIRPDSVPNNAILMRQRMNISQCQRSPTMAYLDQHSSMSVTSNSMSPNRTLSPMSPLGSYVGPKEMIRNDGTISPLCQMGQYSGPKDVMRNDGTPTSPMATYSGPKDIVNRNNSGHINLDLFDNVPDLFDFSDIV
ncbi:mastermind-like protein 1 [Parasteatoda tepidariorum]|uniref:mastermind-like protein 1 n=1 Tax=Parasteatoda tepidariorum TaxID=114398 RepID=UPI001C719B31|nr:formin-J [Parasteatoda tepidariorum]